jgi:ABC-2 type transport system permease protein
MVWAAVGVFVLLMVIVGLSASLGDFSNSSPMVIVVMFTNIGGELLIPIITLMIGYMAIVGERQSGSLRILFGLTHNRRDVFVGKLMSRIGVILFATLIACAAAVVLALALFGTVPVSSSSDSSPSPYCSGRRSPLSLSVFSR